MKQCEQCEWNDKAKCGEMFCVLPRCIKIEPEKARKDAVIRRPA